jgi:hypothetical protein
MAAVIYGIPEDKVTKEQRFVGKTTILGCGYGMGAERFVEQLKTFGVDMPLSEGRRVVKIYRESNANISLLWRDCQNMLVEMSRRRATSSFGPNGVIKYKSTGDWDSGEQYLQMVRTHGHYYPLDSTCVMTIYLGSKVLKA